jgi:hypothetical protein
LLKYFDFSKYLAPIDFEYLTMRRRKQVKNEANVRPTDDHTPAGRSAALQILKDFIQSRLRHVSVDQQILLYQAVGEIMPTARQREDARKIARVLSLAAALQSDFNPQLFRHLERPARNLPDAKSISR